MKVVGLSIYPIKSCRGLLLRTAEVLPRGFKFDRRWMIVDSEGLFVTQREYPKLALVTVDLLESGLRLGGPNMHPLHVDEPSSDASSIDVRVWESSVQSLDGGAEARAWFSTYLGVDTRLVYLPEFVTRLCTSGQAKEGDEVSFADGFPYLLTSMASLADLATYQTEPVPMDRFRGNIIVDGEIPWDEDSWHDIQIGSLRFELLKPCARCKITTTDQATAEVGREPLASLRKFRFDPIRKGLMFGINACARSQGVLSIGDDVQVLSRHASPDFLVKK